MEKTQQSCGNNVENRYEKRTQRKKLIKYEKEDKV